MQRKYGWQNIELLFTDTDSLMYEIFTDDVYQDMMVDKDLYDLSNYPKKHMLYDPTNCKIPLKFKDEVAGKILKLVLIIKKYLFTFP